MTSCVNPGLLLCEKNHLNRKKDLVEKSMLVCIRYAHVFCPNRLLNYPRWEAESPYKIASLKNSFQLPLAMFRPSEEYLPRYDSLYSQTYKCLR